LPKKSEKFVVIKPKDAEDSIDYTKYEDSSEESDELEVEIEQPMEEVSPEKSEELEVRVNKLTDKLKLLALELDKKSADLEIKIGKGDERFKEVAYDFPKFKEKIDGIESLLNVVNLGIEDFKQKFTDIDSRISNLEKMPESVERRIVGLDNKLKKVDEDIKKLYLRLDEISALKQDLIKSMENKIASSSENISREIIGNKAEIQNLKTNLDSLALAIKSFQKTVELTNLDDIIRRFNAIDGKILTIQTEMEKLRTSTRDSSVVASDVNVLNKRFKELVSAVMSSLSKINEYEVRLNKKLTKIEVLEKTSMNLNTVKSMTETVIEQVKIMNEIKTSIEDLYGKIKRIYDSGSVDLGRSQNIQKELSELNKIKNDLKQVMRFVNENRSIIESMWGEENR